MKQIQPKIPGILLLAGIGVTSALSGCYEKLVPGEEDNFSHNMAYNQDVFTVNLGQTNVFIAIFNADYSTQPLDFSIENLRRVDTTSGTESKAPELAKMVEARIWEDYYSGQEKTIEAIESKRTTEQRPVLDIRPHSGELFFWNTNAVEPGTYLFDVRVKNGGGEKLFEDMTLDVRLPHPYEPYEFDDITGERKSWEEGGIIHPDEVVGVHDQLGRELPRDSVVVYFHKTGTEKNTVSFKFFDQDSIPIPLSRFNLMEWDKLKYYSDMLGEYSVFAFNRRFSPDNTSVTFDITNPYPVLADVSGNRNDRSEIRFLYHRVSFNQRVDAMIRFRFAIYEPGQWDIIFKFKTNPKFEND